MNISLIGQFRLQGLQMEIKVIYFPFLFYSTDFNINTVCNGIQQALIQAIIHSHNITFLPLLIKSLLGWMLKGWWYDFLLLKLMYVNKYAWDCLDELSQNNKYGLLESSFSTQLSPYSQGRSCAPFLTGVCANAAQQVLTLALYFVFCPPLRADNFHITKAFLSV